MPETFAQFFNDRLRSLELDGPGGQERFRRLLEERYGTKVTAAAVSHWSTGIRTPGRRYIFAVLDALDVHGADRERALRLAFGVPGPINTQADGLAPLPATNVEDAA
jgi:hypothetical protein